MDFSANPMHEPSFEFYDQSLLDEVNRGDPDAQEFFRLLSLCHTVMPEWNEEGGLEYQAQSPDENALVSAARNFGFVFTKRTPRSITVTFNGQVGQALFLSTFSVVFRTLLHASTMSQTIPDIHGSSQIFPVSEGMSF